MDRWKCEPAALKRGLSWRNEFESQEMGTEVMGVGEIVREEVWTEKRQRVWKRARQHCFMEDRE